MDFRIERYRIQLIRSHEKWFDQRAPNLLHALMRLTDPEMLFALPTKEQLVAIRVARGFMRSGRQTCVRHLYLFAV